MCMHPRVSFGPVDIILAEAKSIPPEPEGFLFQNHAGMLCGTSQLQDLWPGHQSDPQPHSPSLSCADERTRTKWLSGIFITVYSVMETDSVLQDVNMLPHNYSLIKNALL